MAISPRVNGFFSPLIKATYSLPKTALVPLLMLWFGIGGATNITVVVLAALLPLVVYTYHGVHGVPRALVWSAQAMGTPQRRLIWRVLLPAAQQEIYDRLANRAGLFVCHRHFGGNDRVQSAASAS